MLPILLHFGRLSLPTYGFLAAVGLLVGLAIGVRNAGRCGMDPDKTWNAGILAIQILAVTDPKLQKALADFKVKLAEESRAKNRSLRAP